MLRIADGLTQEFVEQDQATASKETFKRFRGSCLSCASAEPRKLKLEGGERLEECQQELQKPHTTTKDAEGKRSRVSQ